MPDPKLIVRLKEAAFFNEGHSSIGRANLEVRSGEFVAVIGKSGAGKTTLLKGIAGLLPSAGEVYRSGRMRLVFQQDRLLPWLTIWRNVALGFPGEAISKTTIAEVLEELGIEHLRDRYPWQMSGGERQRAAGARAFVSRPDLVLMDEPFGSLDVLTRERMQSWLMEYWIKHQVAILFVTHDIEEALIMADRVLILANGSLTGEMIVSFPRPRSPELRFTPKFIEMRKELRARILEAENVAPFVADRD